MSLKVFTVLLLFVYLKLFNADRPSEDERVRLWFERNNTWPPTWQPESQKFKEAMAFREAEIMLIPGARERWENWMQFTSARMIPRFTERGFDLLETPPHIQAKLKRAVDNALKDWENVPYEHIIDPVYTPLQSKFIDLREDLKERIQMELQEIHEQWAGVMELQPTSIYGIRMNQNGSSLVMHYDKTFTHVISSIIHIDHQYYSDEPWPIEIEDHDGQIHAFNLEPGQMLLYESASCLHGRRKILNGKHYSSIFNHYQPVDRSLWNFTTDDVIANVPPHWNDDIIEDIGNRWSGQGITTDSRVTDAVPPRMVNGEIVPDMAEYYRKLKASAEL